MAIIDDVVTAYKKEHSIRAVSRSAGISEQKVRRLLITAGAIQPETSRRILFYLSRGLKKSEIAKKFGISVRALETYLPYSRTPYNQPTRSENAEKLARWRKTGTTLPDKGNEG